MCFVRSPNHDFLQKVTQSDPKRNLNRLQKPPTRTLLDLTKPMVFTVWITHWAASGDLREHTFSGLLFEHCSFVVFCDLLTFGVPNRPQNVRVFFPERWPNSTLPSKVSQGVPREAQELQNGAQVLPKGAKMEVHGC